MNAALGTAGRRGQNRLLASEARDEADVLVAPAAVLLEVQEFVVHHPNMMRMLPFKHKTQVMNLGDAIYFEGFQSSAMTPISLPLVSTTRMISCGWFFVLRSGRLKAKL